MKSDEAKKDTQGNMKLIKTYKSKLGEFRLIIIKFANKLTPKTTFLLSIIPIYKIMPRPKGSPNKITKEVKEQLQNLIDEVVNSIMVVLF